MRDYSLMQMNRPCDVFLMWHSRGDINLNPPYQRGDVWGVKRKRSLIKSMVMGIPIPSLIINDRFHADWPDGDTSYAVIDGKQRLTAILGFLQDSFAVPGEWFSIPKDQVFYSQLTIGLQRRFKNIPVACSEGKLASVEAEKEIFDLVNFGGLQQGEVDVD